MKSRENPGKLGNTGVNNWSVCKSQKGDEPGSRSMPQPLQMLDANHSQLGKVKFGVKVMKLMNSLIVWKVTF